MSGFYIQIPPLSKEMAEEISRLLDQLTIKAVDARGILTLKGSLGRIASGQDEIITKEQD